MIKRFDDWLNDVVEFVNTPVPDPKNCFWCEQVIEPNLCWCGMYIDEHDPFVDGHSPVPMGCDCFKQFAEGVLPNGKAEKATIQPRKPWQEGEGDEGWTTTDGW